MRCVIHIGFVLLFPVIISGQTVHIDSGKIVYKGIVKIDQVNKNELYARAKLAILDNVQASGKSLVTDDDQKGMISAKGSIRLASPYYITKTVEYILELSVDDGKYKYRIDSVYLKEMERGGKTKKTSSEKLVKAMDESEPISNVTERQLNEIDMNFQKLLDLIRSDMNRMTGKKPDQ